MGSQKILTTSLIASIIRLAICYAAEQGQGFILYCPCMGRFGNQAEQLLGSIHFAKLLNRTLILPPFIHYGINHTPELVPFERILQLETIKKYYDVLLLADFMNQDANTVWPVGKRRFYCYSQRGFTQMNEQSCNALQGEPFNTFWSSFGVSEDSSTYYKPLTTNPESALRWSQMYPPSSHPVLTFVGAPSPFPAHKDSTKLQKYIKISEPIEKVSKEFMDLMGVSGKPYLSMHVRHGSDWKKACQLLLDGPKTRLFSSNQCTGYPPDDSGHTLEYETCFPSYETMSRDLSEALTKFKERHNLSIQVVHIATDFDSSELWRYLEKMFPNVRFIRLKQASIQFTPDYMIDIYLMTHADVFIGNCVSSFSAFPARIRREQLNLDHETYYFNYKCVTSPKDEL